MGSGEAQDESGSLFPAGISGKPVSWDNLLEEMRRVQRKAWELLAKRIRG